MKKKLKKLGIAVVIVCGILVAFVMCSSSEVPEDVEYIAVDSVEMYDELSANAYSAEEKYSDMYVKIEGEISVIDSDGEYISLKVPSDKYWLESILCNFTEDEQKEILKDKTIGDTVIIEGQISEIGEILGYSVDIHTIK